VGLLRELGIGLAAPALTRSRQYASARLEIARRERLVSEVRRVLSLLTKEGYYCSFDIGGVDWDVYRFQDGDKTGTVAFRMKDDRPLVGHCVWRISTDEEIVRDIEDDKVTEPS
jgi:hypothetical protein